MPNFKPFGLAVHERYNQLAKDELFVTIDGDSLWAAYLAAFPEGTNPMYKSRTEHDCSCCRQFIRNLGNVVAIKNGKLHSVWGHLSNLEYPYDVVAAKLDEVVTSHAVTSLFRSKEPGYGALETKQLLEDKTVIRWNHFYGQVFPRHKAASPAEAIGTFNTTAQVFGRGLTELKLSALDDVLGMIDAKALYRGEEHKKSVTDFRATVVKYAALQDAAKSIFVWENAATPTARFRNTVIGTLVQDLSEGVDLEKAVKSFEAKVAPANYKRPTALITPGMVQSAMKTINELGLTEALERRFATISDVSVNNVLWVDNEAKAKMASPVESLLMAVAKKSVKVKEVQGDTLTVDEFIQQVLPQATGVELEVKNQHSTNLMALTAPKHADTASMFKWKNDFGWSYNGNIADSDIRREVQARGGSVSGVLRFSHQWNYGKRNASLMDLHVFMPGSTAKIVTGKAHDVYGSGQRVGWNNRKDSASGGVQDVDYVNPAPVGYIPVENITFPTLAQLKDGKYVCAIHNWQLRQPTEGGFRAEIECGGVVYQYEYDKAMGNKEWVIVAEVNLRAGTWTVDHKLPHSAMTKEVWGIQTENFVKVKTLMLSPNHWDDNAVGNKHFFFVLDGCKADSPMRGIYNEFLSPKLEAHRKVFEVLGDRTKCQPTDEQLAGLGFSSTRNDKVTVRVSGPKLHNKVFNVTF